MLQRLRTRSLLSRFVLLVIAPLSLVLFGVIAVNMVAYQRTLTSLLVSRDQQLAAAAMERVADTLQGYAAALAGVAKLPDVHSASARVRAAALANSSWSLGVFTAGVVIVDSQGQMLATTAPSSPPVENTVANQDYFKQVQARQQPIFSDALRHAGDGRYLVIIAVPVLDEHKAFWGALLGAFYLDDSTIERSLQRVTIGEQGYVYVVDRQGHALFHPDPQNIGAVFTDEPFVKEVMAGQSGGTLWSITGADETLVIGYAPVQGTGWGLIVREFCDSVLLRFGSTA